jgi:hypothetical protein
MGASAMEKNDYYMLDTVTYTNVKLGDFGLVRNCLFCHEFENDSLKQFTPEQVKEYGIGGEQLYVAMDVPLDKGMKRVFLLKKEVGTYNLYHYKDKRQEKYFLQLGDGSLLELRERGNSSKNFRHQLSAIFKENASIATASNQVNYTTKSIVTFLEQCQGFKSNLSTRWGVSFGTDFSRLSPPSAYFDLTQPIQNDQYKAAPSVGLFLEKELFRGGLFVHAACNATWTTASYHQLNGNLDNDFVANLRTLDVPIQLKYIMTVNRLKTYVEAGGLFLWNFQNDHFIQQSRITGHVVDMLGVTSQGMIDDFYAGPSLAIGLEIPLYRSISLITECRVDKSFGVTKANQCDLTKIVITTGFVF